MDSYCSFTIGISIFLALSNFVWWKLCEALTTFETHYTWTQYRKHLVVKYYIFKVLNLSSVFLTRWLVSHYYNGIRQRLPVFKYAYIEIEFSSNSLFPSMPFS